jgi:hypothetical protein
MGENLGIGSLAHWLILSEISLGKLWCFSLKSSAGMTNGMFSL